MKKIEFKNKDYWNSRLTNHFDLIGVGDISMTKNYNLWSYKVTRHRLKHIFKKYVPYNCEVLDLGAGTGFVVDIWKKLGKKVFGVDISKKAVSQLSKKYKNFRFYELDAGKQDLPFKQNSLGAVSASSVLYHIVEDDSLNFLLKNVYRVLNDDGFFIFSDNFIHNKNVRSTHQNCRSLEEYEKILFDNGFIIIDRVSNYVLLNDPVDSKNKIHPFFWRLISKLSKKWIVFDRIIWPVLYPIELILTSLINESPAQEIMICKPIKGALK